MSQPPNFKSEVFTQLARIAHALSTPGRLALIEMVAQGERGVEELARLTGMSIANASKHLAELRQAGLLSARKEGLRVYHTLAGPDVVVLISALRHIAEDRNAEVNQLIRTFVTSRDELEPIPATELLERVQAGLVTVLDVRPVEEYAAGHLPRAINMPPDRLAECINKLANSSDCHKDQEIVAYCRGPYCLFSVEAVERLREKGCCARRLEDGFPEWKAAGLPVEV
ncbi:MAG: metalloregulator ArsR/SmtB family transcription factor [Rhodocyclaceae bacterium]|nr:metalloregulator ArsR/SmtB family transcription factor [Rhodocyclaceae bacterium]